MDVVSTLTKDRLVSSSSRKYSRESKINLPLDTLHPWIILIIERLRSRIIVSPLSTFLINTMHCV